MSIKNKLKNSYVASVYIYLRYWVKRYIVNKSFASFILEKGVELKSVDKSGVNFFGYYNISPENMNGDIIYLKVNEEKIRGSLFEPASIMLKKKDGSISKIAKTNSWNWQQGCMLQWMPNNPNQILFNDYDTEKDCYISKIVDTTGKIIKIFDKPINSVSKTGNFALSLNYDRLAEMRPDYGYFNRSETSLPEDDEDGVWHINLLTGKIELIVSLEQLKNISFTDTMEKAMHKVNHIDINPSGNRFMFLHRWIGPQGRYMRLITANCDGSDMKILNGDKMTSHSCWLNDSEILSFCEVEDQIGYFYFKDRSDEVKLFSELMPKFDGHPSISPDKKHIILDTYPDLSRFSNLYLYNFQEDSIKTIGCFLQPLRYKKEIRVDLHPKWSNNGEGVYFESAHNKNRKLYKVQFK
jgi:hypothetical protein